MITLDFNFNLRTLSGEITTLSAAKALGDLFDAGQTQDEKLLDKKGIWATNLKENSGVITLDRVDAKDLKDLIVRSSGTFDFARKHLKDYIQDKIDSENKESGAKKNK